MNLATGNSRILLTHQSNISYNGLTLAEDGQIYIAQFFSDDQKDQRGTQLLQINPQDASKKIIYSNVGSNSSANKLTLERLSDIAIDPVNKILYGSSSYAIINSNQTQEGIIAFNYGTSTFVWRSTMSGAAPLAFTKKRLYQIDIYGDITREVDQRTGQLGASDNIVSTNRDFTETVGSGPAMSAYSLAIDDSGENLYVTGSKFYRLSLASGYREPIADIACGETCEIELAGNSAYIVEGQETKNIYKIDIQNGAKTLISGANLGSGNPISYAQGLAFDEPHQKLISAELYAPVLSIDVKTGKRQSFWTGYPNFQPPAPEVRDLWLTSNKKRLFIWSPRHDEILSAEINNVPVVNGSFKIIAYRSFDNSAMAIDESRKMLYLTNRNFEPLVRADFSKALIQSANTVTDNPWIPEDLITGFQAVTRADAEQSSFEGYPNTGVLLQYPIYGTAGLIASTLALDQRNQIAYMLEPRRGIIAISLLTGDRVLISR